MKVKNIGIYAHVDAGKTTITENLLFKANIIKEIGRVDNGTTYTDDMSIEKRRGISIQSAPVSFELTNKTKINLIDTPGHADFIAEVERSMNVLDGAILVISAKEGIQSQTYLIFDTLKALKIPTIIFVNKIDRLGVNINKVVKSIKTSLSEFAIPIQSVDIKSCNVSDLFDCNFDNLLDILTKKDDQLLSYFVNGDLSNSKVRDSFIDWSKKGEVYPVIFGSALKHVGTDQLLGAIKLFLPEQDINTSGDLALTVFKIKHTKESKRTYIRLFEGCINTRDYVNNEKITKINILEKGQVKQSDCLKANDIGIIYGPNLKVNQSIGNINREIISLGEPTSKIKILPAKSTTKFDLINALNIITEEDPFLEYELSEINNDIYLNIFGEIQLEILAERMSTDFGVYVTFDKVQTIFKETPKKVGEHFIELYDKTYPFYAGIGCKIEPLCKKSGVDIVSEVSTGHLLKTFQNGIIDGINRYIDQGLMGWPLTDLRVTITEGKYDSVKSTPSDFRDLAPIVLMKALEKAETKLLWPILSFRIKVPEYAIGKT